jgi:hypothetical protein
VRSERLDLIDVLRLPAMPKLDIGIYQTGLQLYGNLGGTSQDALSSCEGGRRKIAPLSSDCK